MRKRYLTLFLSLILVVSGLSGCSGAAEDLPVNQSVMSEAEEIQEEIAEEETAEDENIQEDTMAAEKEQSASEAEAVNEEYEKMAEKFLKQHPIPKRGEVPEETDGISLQEFNSMYLDGEILEELSELYRLEPESYAYTLINSRGNVLSADDVFVEEIRDVFTNECRYYMAYYYRYDIDEEKTAELGYPARHTSMFSRIYDINGYVLSDFKEIYYHGAFGDWLNASKYVSINDYEPDMDFDNHVFNPKTGETNREISRFFRANDTLSVAVDQNDEYAFVCDQNGQTVISKSELEDMKGDLDNISFYGNYIIAENQYANKFKFYDLKKKYLGKIDTSGTEGIQYSGENTTPYIYCDNKIYDPSSGNGEVIEPLFKIFDLEYLDEENAIENPWGSSASETYLWDTKKGCRITEGYDKIVVGTSGEDAVFFSKKGNAIYTLGRNGEVIAQTEIPGLEDIYSINGMITCEIGKNWDNECLLDRDLNMIIPPGIYRHITQMMVSDPFEDTDYLIGEYYMGGSDRYDVLRADGTILVKGLSEYGYILKQRFAAKRGRSVGLMDMDGNWIYQLSVDDISNED